MTARRYFAAFYNTRGYDRRFGVDHIVLLAALCLFTPQVAPSQETEIAVVTKSPPVSGDDSGVTKQSAVPQPVDSEISETNMIGYGSRKIFGAAERCNLWMAGVEYDRPVRGSFLKARMDYVAEVLPFVLLSEPVAADIYGNEKSPYQQLVHGFGVTPLGFRMLWRSNRAVKPYMIGEAGVVVFSKKVLATQATAANFAFQGDAGFEFRLAPRVELRVEPLDFFHFSNGDLGASNPGVDVLAAKFGISYHLGKSGR